MSDKEKEPFFEWFRYTRKQTPDSPEHSASRGPLKMIIFENGNYLLGDPVENGDEGEEYLAAGVFHWGHETGEFIGMGGSVEEAVENAKMVAEGIALAKIKPLWDALANHIGLNDSDEGTAENV